MESVGCWMLDVGCEYMHRFELSSILLSSLAISLEIHAHAHAHLLLIMADNGIFNHFFQSDMFVHQHTHFTNLPFPPIFS